MALTVNQKKDIARDLMRIASQRLDEIPISKLELYNTITEVDDQFDLSQVDLNNAISAGPRAALNQKMKLKIFKDIMGKRWEVE